MKKYINMVSDYIVLAVIVFVAYHFTDAVTTAVILLFQIVLGVLYHICATTFAPLAKSIPTINSSWLSIDGFNAKAFWRRRILQILFSYGLLLILVVFKAGL
ncbi:MAG: hypothetical protein NC548_10895 [Lachnospiraceae bacterium]|nr:hypothetical protein [Lachnospiraceae bacterium]MCM1235275.1 hypothetical protein [Ruminococcus flavefaciens]